MLRNPIQLGGRGHVVAMMNLLLPGPSVATAVQGLCPHSGCLGVLTWALALFYGASASARCRNTGAYYSAAHSTR